MTQAEYVKAYKEARRQSGIITLKVQRELKTVFEEAAELAAKEVKRATEAGLSDLTSSAWEQINLQLQNGADLISEATSDKVPQAITDSYINYLKVDENYIMDAVGQAGISEITRAGITNMGVAVDFRLLNIQATRLFTDGYTFQQRVWNIFDTQGKPIGLNGDYQYRIKNLILTGQAQGRDAVKIAEDIQLYVTDGKDAVFTPGRYGKLKPGTAQYKMRISKKVDWRALRIVRSELNASLQTAGIQEGIINPGSIGMYDWVKTTGNPVDPNGSKNSSGKRCIDLEREGPYTKDIIESFGYQHSNCSCSIRPVLEPQPDFVKRLKEWNPGTGNDPQLETWYNNIYLPAQV